MGEINAMRSDTLFLANHANTLISSTETHDFLLVRIMHTEIIDALWRVPRQQLRARGYVLEAIPLCKCTISNVTLTVQHSHVDGCTCMALTHQSERGGIEPSTMSTRASVSPSSSASLSCLRR
jgi:hypothetical protein